MKDTKQLTKIQMANLILNEDKKSKLADTLCSFYGVKNVSYSELSYGIVINISGSDSFRFIKDAIEKVLETPSDTISVLTESKKDLTASYVYLPERDKNLHKKIKFLGR